MQNAFWPGAFAENSAKTQNMVPVFTKHDAIEEVPHVHKYSGPGNMSKSAIFGRAIHAVRFVELLHIKIIKIQITAMVYVVSSLFTVVVALGSITLW